MKRNIIIVLITILGLSLISANDISATTDSGKKVFLHDDGTWSYNEPVETSTDTFDIRKASWYMNMEQVKESEPFEWTEGEVNEDIKYIITSIDFLGEDSYLAYYFNADRLYQVKYIINEDHSNKTDYWRAFKRFIDALKSKYGETKPGNSGKPIWKNRLSEDDPDNWGLAISKGEMLALAAWETERSEVFTQIDGDNYKINLIVSFEAKNFEFGMLGSEKTPAF
ncbi:MAG: hypothetical protein PF693_21650 [Spirochaetia bacterium]|jgi:hypothetical protein|nr:hypothetical protein [Spirochaetia bacterium]